MKEIKLQVSEDNESTSAPYWLILNPRQMMKPDIYNLASMITGPFFSREAAQAHLTNRRYEFGKHAVVFCHSGYWSREYKEAINLGVDNGKT